MPFALCTAFAESREYPQLQAQYHDGITERSQLAQTSRRTFKLAQRLTATRVAALKAFWDAHQGGVFPFLFYNLAEGSYDPTGNSTQGRTRSCSAATGRRLRTLRGPTSRRWSSWKWPELQAASRASTCKRLPRAANAASI